VRLLDILGFAVGATRGRKLRTVLTTLGVVIGIAAIVSLISLSQGLQASVTGQLQSGLATDTLIVTPVNPAERALLISDEASIEAIDEVARAVPAIQGAAYLEVHGSTTPVDVVGVDLGDYQTVYGAVFVSEEGDAPMAVDDGIVIGSAVSDPDQNGERFARPGDAAMVWLGPVTDESVTRHYYTRITSVLREIGGLRSGGLSDTAVYIPLAQAAELYGTDECSYIIVQLKSDDQATVDAATNAIKERFQDQVRVSSPKSIHDLVSGVFSTLNIFLISIASISLMVAGIGIMNVMMVSLIERRREIGILKALGMKDRTILAIFLCEASLIGALGGTTGAVVGFVAASVIAGFLGTVALPSQLGEWAAEGFAITPVLDPTVFVGAIIFGLMVSLVFALYPAWRSSRLMPVVALRHE